ncbi:MAG: PadR family transcriptional regulator [Candidatus Sericytochromatia bacterium]
MAGGYCQGGPEEAGTEESVRFGHRGFRGPWGHGGHGFGGHGMGGPGGFPPFFQGRRGRVRRGDVRAAILALLAEQPRNGYQLIQEIGERSGGNWKPSPGSIYPALQQLEDEGLVRAEDSSEGKKLFALTEAGEAWLREQPQEAAPWENLGEQLPEALQEFQALMGQVMAASMMVAQAANESQLEKARQILNQTRKSLYQILAEDEEGTRG